MFITFEGGEGAGKSTQIERLVARLRGMGYAVCKTREPGGSPNAEAIRSVLLSGRAKPLGALGEAYLFAAARIDHLETTIRPALARGDIVICDRFMDSTRVYQGAAGGLPVETIDLLEHQAVGSTRPNLTIILDIPVDIGLARAQSRNSGVDRFEADAVAIHQARRNGFLTLATTDPTRCRVIDATASVDIVELAIWRAVSPALSVRGS